MTGWRTVKDPPAGPLGASLPAAPAALSVGALQARVDPLGGPDDHLFGLVPARFRPAGATERKLLLCIHGVITSPECCLHCVYIMYHDIRQKSAERRSGSGLSGAREGAVYPHSGFSEHGLTH